MICHMKLNSHKAGHGLHIFNCYCSCFVPKRLVLRSEVLRPVAVVLLLAVASAVAAPPSHSPTPLSNVPPGGSRLVAGALSLGTILRVNGDAITSSQIIAPLSEQLCQWGQTLDERSFLAKAQPLLLETTTAEVYTLLLYQQAQRELENLENADAILEKLISEERKKILAKYGGSEARARAELTAQATSIEEQLSFVRRQLVVSAFRQAHFDPALEITPSQIAQYYRTHLREQYQQEPTVQFQLIDIQAKTFLPVLRDSSERDSERATGQGSDERQLTIACEQAASAASEALQEIDRGADFADVAKKFSHGFRAGFGGLWRLLNPKVLKPQYKPVVLALDDLAVGQCSEIISAEKHPRVGPLRFFIAKLIARKDAQVVPFLQAKSDIIETLQQRAWQRFRRKLSAKLFQKATIGDLEHFVADTAQAAYRQFQLSRSGEPQ